MNCSLNETYALDGERGLRYTLLDMGHVITNVALAARALGWSAHQMSVSDETMAKLLGLDRYGYYFLPF